MLPNDPTPVCSDYDLKIVAHQMRISADEDDDYESYSKTKEEADTLSQRMSEEEYDHYKNHGGSRAIWLQTQDGPKLVSLSMTTDDHHGYKWHLSMCQVTGPGELGRLDDKSCKTINDAFFGEWKDVPNPGKMEAVLHFVGND